MDKDVSNTQRFDRCKQALQLLAQRDPLISQLNVEELYFKNGTSFDVLGGLFNRRKTVIRPVWVQMPESFPKPVWREGAPFMPLERFPQKEKLSFETFSDFETI